MSVQCASIGSPNNAGSLRDSSMFGKLPCSMWGESPQTLNLKPPSLLEKLSFSQAAIAKIFDLRPGAEFTAAIKARSPQRESRGQAQILEHRLARMWKCLKTVWFLHMQAFRRHSCDDTIAVVHPPTPTHNKPRNRMQHADNRSHKRVVSAATQH